jgi:hypothetical protein
MYHLVHLGVLFCSKNMLTFSLEMPCIILAFRDRLPDSSGKSILILDRKEKCQIYPIPD